MTKPTPPDEVRLFEVETPFHQKAKRKGGISKERAIEAAQAQIEKAKPGFEQWLDDELKELASLIERVKNGEDSSNWLEDMDFRAHQLRDSASTLEFELLSFVATALCEILDSIKAGNACNMEAIRCNIDALLLAGQKSYRRLRPEQVPDLTNGLHRIVKHVTN
jgi:hypothetical protein